MIYYINIFIIVKGKLFKAHLCETHQTICSFGRTVTFIIDSNGHKQAEKLKLMMNFGWFLVCKLRFMAGQSV